MREIEFRGKRKDNGKWLYGNYVHCDKFINEHKEVKKPFRTIIPIVFIDEEVFGLELHDKDFDVIPETVGQYTGSRDKNGHPIYEDDLISFGDGIYRIVFEDACFWISDVRDTGYTMELHTILGQGEIEVIGNVHEVPELLEVKA